MNTNTQHTISDRIYTIAKIIYIYMYPLEKHHQNILFFRFSFKAWVMVYWKQMYHNTILFAYDTTNVTHLVQYNSLLTTKLITDVWDLQEAYEHDGHLKISNLRWGLHHCVSLSNSSRILLLKDWVVKHMHHWPF